MKEMLQKESVSLKKNARVQDIVRFLLEMGKVHIDF